MTKNDLEKRVSSLEKENKRLGMTAKKYRHLMQNIPDIVYVLDKNGWFRELNLKMSAPIVKGCGTLLDILTSCMIYRVRGIQFIS